jgi:uncharacterized protein
MSMGDLRRKLEAFARFPSVIHGSGHWFRVRRFGALLAEREGLPPAARQCVEIFSLVHDLARVHDGGGNQHAIDGAQYVDDVVPAVFGAVPQGQVEIVRMAIRYHSDGLVARRASEHGLFDPLEGPPDLVLRTVACCWDADRLDLPRVGIRPHPDLMSTTSWREVLPLALRYHGFP